MDVATVVSSDVAGAGVNVGAVDVANSADDAAAAGIRVGVHILTRVLKIYTRYR